MRECLLTVQTAPPILEEDEEDQTVTYIAAS